jgi:hypothetical protein
MKISAMLLCVKEDTMMHQHAIRTFWVLAFSAASSAFMGRGWPTYRHAPSRSGVTTERLALLLEEIWVHRPKHAPRPAWPPPAKQDFWHGHKELQPAVTYDRSLHVAAANGSIFDDSSADDELYCPHGTTVAVRWTFFGEGPVRLAPTVFGNGVYAGSDDGCV